MRSHLQTAQRQIVVCCILHNIAETLSDELPDQVETDDPHQRPVVEARPLVPPPGVAPILVLPVEVTDAARKREGERKRDEVYQQFLALNLQ